MCCFGDQILINTDDIVLQVYLATWQETAVAVKVITQMQNLSSLQGIHPQDPVTMSA